MINHGGIAAAAVAAVLLLAQLGGARATLHY
jgi:hypothetical protein